MAPKLTGFEVLTSCKGWKKDMGRVGIFLRGHTQLPAKASTYMEWYGSNGFKYHQPIWECLTNYESYLLNPPPIPAAAIPKTPVPAPVPVNQPRRQRTTSLGSVYKLQYHQRKRREDLALERSNRQVNSLGSAFARHYLHKRTKAAVRLNRQASSLGGAYAQHYLQKRVKAALRPNRQASSLGGAYAQQQHLEEHDPDLIGVLHRFKQDELSSHTKAFINGHTEGRKKAAAAWKGKGKFPASEWAVTGELRFPLLRMKQTFGTRTQFATHTHSHFTSPQLTSLSPHLLRADMVALGPRADGVDSVDSDLGESTWQRNLFFVYQLFNYRVQDGRHRDELYPS
jgi:hypothetical protein